MQASEAIAKPTEEITLPPQILKPFVFCLEISREGISQDDVFSYTIQQMGGKVLKAMGKSATHFIWSNGKLRSLLKASELGLQIVSPLWLKACTDQGRAVPEDDFRPSNLKEKIETARAQLAPTDIKRKRAAPDQLTIVEAIGVKQEESNVLKTEAEVNATAAMLDRVKKEKKEEQYFQREFAKEIKRLNKPEESKISKTDIYDQFVDGELTVVEFIEQVNLKQSRIKQSKKRQLNQSALPPK